MVSGQKLHLEFSLLCIYICYVSQKIILVSPFHSICNILPHVPFQFQGLTIEITSIPFLYNKNWNWGLLKGCLVLLRSTLFQMEQCHSVSSENGSSSSALYKQNFWHTDFGSLFSEFCRAFARKWEKLGRIFSAQKVLHLWFSLISTWILWIKSTAQ